MRLESLTDTPGIAEYALGSRVRDLVQDRQLIWCSEHQLRNSKLCVVKKSSKPDGVTAGEPTSSQDGLRATARPEEGGNVEGPRTCTTRQARVVSSRYRRLCVCPPWSFLHACSAPELANGPFFLRACMQGLRNRQSFSVTTVHSSVPCN